MRAYKIITTLFFCIITMLSFAQDLQINSEKSTLNWTGKAAFNAYSLTGTLTVKNGALEIKNDSLISLMIMVNMKSLDHENGDLKAHLKGKDFFDVKTYSEATFVLTHPTTITYGEAKIKGKMTVRGITKIESFYIKFNQDNSSFSFNITIDRTLYGIKFNSPSFFNKMKENAIADEFKLIGNLKIE